MSRFPASESESDVVVVGSGPAGALAAALLARAGLRVDLVEKAAFPRETVCGEFVSGEGVASLRRVGALDRLGPLAAVEWVRLHAASGRVATAPFPSVAGEKARAIPRAALDAALRDLAVESGARLRAETRVERCLFGADGAVAGVEAVTSAGERLRLRAPLTVGADGKSSVVARETGALAAGVAPEKWAGFAAHLDRPPGVESGAIDLYFFPGGYGGVVALDAATVNVCGLADARALPRERDARSLFRATFLANPAARERFADVEPPREWRTTGALPLGRRTASGPGFVLVGDAAGMIDPFTGDGIAMALSGATILAAAVAAARHAGDFPRGAERRYARAARAEFSRRRVTSRLLRVAAKLPRLGDAAIAIGSRSAPILDAWIRWTRG